MLQVTVLVQPSHLVIARRAWLHDLALVGLLVLHTPWMDLHARCGLRTTYTLTVSLGAILSDLTPSSSLPRG